MDCTTQWPTPIITNIRGSYWPTGLSTWRNTKITIGSVLSFDFISFAKRKIYIFMYVPVCVCVHGHVLDQLNIEPTASHSTSSIGRVKENTQESNQQQNCQNKKINKGKCQIPIEKYKINLTAYNQSQTETTSTEQTYVSVQISCGGSGAERICNISIRPLEQSKTHNKYKGNITTAGPMRSTKD